MNSLRIGFQDLRLLPGRYFLSFGIRAGRKFEDWIQEAVAFEVIPSAASAEIDADTWEGAIVPNGTMSTLSRAHIE